jgi:hypothetical protein
MRYFLPFLATAAVLTLNLPASKAQDAGGGLPELQKARYDAEEAWRKAQQLTGQSSQNYAAANNRTQTSAATYNGMADRLSASVPPAAIKTEFFNNVTSLRTKDDFAKWVDKTKDDWGARYGPRIREFDPYNNTEYSRYYDAKGQLMVRAVQGDYELFKRSHDDLRQSYKRAVDAKEKAEQDYKDAVDKFGDMQTANQSATRAAGDLDMATRRLNDFLGRQPNSTTGGGVAASEPTLENPVRPTGSSRDLTGMKWGNNGRVDFTFLDSRNAIYHTSPFSTKGTYQTNGNKITMYFPAHAGYGANTRFEGTITGNTMEGTTTMSYPNGVAPGRTDSFSAQPISE